MHPNIVVLVLVHQTQKRNGGSLLVIGGYSFVLQLGLMQVIKVNQLVPRDAVYLLLGVTQMMFTTATIPDRCCCCCWLRKTGRRKLNLLVSVLRVGCGHIGR